MLSQLSQYTKNLEHFSIWQLDLSIFSSFHDLRLLNLSYNTINSSLSCFGSKKLKVLDLSANSLEGSIPSCFGSLSSLAVLNLGDNYLNGTLGLQVPIFLGMKKLQVLDLSANGFNGGIPISLGNLSSLRVLDLDYNELTGFLPMDVFNGLHSLQELRLKYNQLNGALPPDIGRLASLKLLDLSDNAMEGNMASQIFTNLTSLQYLDLSANYFNGHFSFLDLANLSKLEAVILSNNEELAVHLGGVSWVPLFQLKFLLMSSCILDKETPVAPIFLSSQYKLEMVDLSNNDLGGNFPNRWFENQTRLGFLRLRNNSLQGNFQLANSPKPSMKILDLSLNSIGGSLPSNIGMSFPGMLLLNFSTNNLIGDMPSSLGNMSSLKYLDLSDNNLSGELPASLITNCTALSLLKLSNNNLNGTLVSFNHVRPPYLDFVFLDGNKFTGTLPSNLSVHKILDVHDNQLSGEIRGTIGSSTNLHFLNVKENSFVGRDLLQYLCNLTRLSVLDLSKNKFSGRIPHCLPSDIEYINLAGNSFTGSIPGAFFGSSFSFLHVLDLSNNQLSGNLPSHIIGDDMDMAILILSGNAFEGPVPNQLCKLQSLQMLDLSHNLLSGSIPSCFGKMQLGLNGGFVIGDMSFAIASLFGSTITTYMQLSGRKLKSMVGHDVLETEVDFVTKGNKHGYQTGHRVWMAGIDLSANRLTGGIPPELGNLSRIISLNLSYNCLTGPIPTTFSNLTQIESLDLSHNKLSGKIPWQLTQLTSLEVFSVAHNNLSGCLPEFKNQFATFNESSYEGNIGLHGPPLEKACTSSSSLKVPHEEESMHDRDFDTIILYAVPVASFAVGFWVCIAVLYCNHKGRYIRMQFIDRFADSLCERISLIVYKLKLANQNGIKARHR